MKVFDKNKDGRLDLNDLARETQKGKNDFEKIFAHLDVVSSCGFFSPNNDSFFCLQPSITGVDLDKFRQILLHHCDVNKDGKIQKSELALCLGLKMNP
uniref:EF-hand domain-containing protein n=1 Tax=Chelonoidis abingdonii TaxID=106734 RepID=A0A8C0G769_CHEAB